MLGTSTSAPAPSPIGGLPSLRLSECCIDLYYLSFDCFLSIALVFLKTKVILQCLTHFICFSTLLFFSLYHFPSGMKCYDHVPSLQICRLQFMLLVHIIGHVTANVVLLSRKKKLAFCGASSETNL